MDAVIIPVRDLVDVAASRAVNELQRLYQRMPGMTRLEEAWEAWGQTPGGIVFSLNPLDQARLLALRFHQLVHQLTDADTPIVFLAFPRIVQDSDYLFSKLQPFLPAGLSPERAREAHRALADHDKVRIEGELARCGEATFHISPELQYPPHGQLDSISVRRELEQVRAKLESARNEVIRVRNELNGVLSELDHRTQTIDQLRVQLARKTEALTAVSAKLKSIRSTASWRLTKPLRALRALGRSKRRRRSRFQEGDVTGAPVPD